MPSLVGSEMCIRDRATGTPPIAKLPPLPTVAVTPTATAPVPTAIPVPPAFIIPSPINMDALSIPCLLYTSDAADDLLCVDLGGRRVIKKKKSNKK